jgi:hypothetical protein
VVDAALEAFDIGGVDEELGAMRFEKRYGVFTLLAC